MARMWPWWTKADEPENGIYRLTHVAGVQLEPGGTETPIAVFESLRGYLNVAVPLTKLGGTDGMMLWADQKEAQKDLKQVSDYRPYPGSIGELAGQLWSVHPSTIRASGMTRQQWYAKKISDYIDMKRCLGEED